MELKIDLVISELYFLAIKKTYKYKNQIGDKMTDYELKVGSRLTLSGNPILNNVETLSNLLLEVSKERLHEIAISDNIAQYTYEETILHANVIATELRKNGASYNDCIGLFIDSSADLAIGMWGILFSGASYLPLATDYPQDRLEYMLKDANVSIVLTNNTTISKLEKLLLPGTKIVNIDKISYSSATDTKKITTVLSEQAGSDIAYVIYTSGTTGKPKGVAISHKAIVSQLNWIKSEGYLEKGLSIIQKTPVSFDAAQWELLGICCGAKVVMGTLGIYRDPEGLIQQIIQHKVTTLQGVPTLLQALIELPQFSDCHSIINIFSGGEGLSKKLAKKILETMPKVNLVNLYGPTECTINSTHYKIDSESIKGEWEVAPIGLPVNGLECHILDQNLVRLPQGEIGELYISGHQLANGYLYNPEQTQEKFPLIDLYGNGDIVRLYRTGDLVKKDINGTIHFVGRVDNQIKFRGYRIELDEIRLAIENHDWVSSAAVFVKENSHSGQPLLVGCIELNPNEALLMDQNNAESHHQTKSTRIQIKAQLSGNGFKNDDELSGKVCVNLEGSSETKKQRDIVFARKTYRFFNGGNTTYDDIKQLLKMKPSSNISKKLEKLDTKTFGEILRYLGQFKSEERLLPKFGYASPGALYATQVYIEICNICDITSGYYYYHPLKHKLFLISKITPSSYNSKLKLHFIGKMPAIRNVYKNNIKEVLEMESGHIIGMFDYILPEYGFGIGKGYYSSSITETLDLPEEHVYLGSYEIVPFAEQIEDVDVDVYIQSHQGKINNLKDGTYFYKKGELEKISNFVVEKRHVIAINQQVYQRSSGGITFVSNSLDTWRNYIDLGRSLQRLQMNRIGIGTMSSGYSSKSGNDLASAIRINAIISNSNRKSGPSYFCLFGKISEEQSFHIGMAEDAVHMKGPAELIREDLLNTLPDYMVPSKIFIVNKMPHSASGKVNIEALKRSEEFNFENVERKIIPPKTTLERNILKIWTNILGLEEISIEDDFFAIGGNSIQAVSIAKKINNVFSVSLPVQVIFESPTIEKLAVTVGHGAVATPNNRAIQLSNNGKGTNVFCWPGLGGYPMNLRMLAESIVSNGNFYGIQSIGINVGEIAFESIESMAKEDIRLIKTIQPTGPYNLCGYSFGSRVAYEVAYQLSQMGEVVNHVTLLAPGSPKLNYEEPISKDENILFSNPAFLTILLSVFSHEINENLSKECIKNVKNKTNFIDFIKLNFSEIDDSLINSIIDVVSVTYSPEYVISLDERKVFFPIKVIRAKGDSKSFIEGGEKIGLDISYYDINSGHYTVLKQNGIDEIMKLNILLN
ncbi:amino acid adenylation domain-containing protein [Xenorhabdus khoisanae]|uniref:amino acid adenylation domain-containing protein n=1 Tax=Xenorhabdus khoisanae TaxID=880157 RepID=UPI00069D5ABC|nr:amino acid adenylation domain-containing protein [Xenorhabdus khoisanae]